MIETDADQFQNRRCQQQNLNTKNKPPAPHEHSSRYSRTPFLCRWSRGHPLSPAARGHSHQSPSPEARLALYLSHPGASLALVQEAAWRLHHPDRPQHRPGCRIVTCSPTAPAASVAPPSAKGAWRAKLTTGLKRQPNTPALYVRPGRIGRVAVVGRLEVEACRVRRSNCGFEMSPQSGR
jgi:hypothetical protein